MCDTYCGTDIVTDGLSEQRLIVREGWLRMMSTFSVIYVDMKCVTPRVGRTDIQSDQGLQFQELLYATKKFLKPPQPPLWTRADFAEAN